MPTIELSNATIGPESWMHYSTNQMLDLNAQRTGVSANVATCGLLTGNVSDSGNTPHASAMINIMGGIAQNSLLGLSGYSDRESDILASFTTPYGPSGEAAVQNFTMVTSTVNPVIINTNYKAAVGTGTATWFRWMVVTRSTGSGLPDGFIHQIIGTVGLPGSGADLEMDDTDIVAGVQYRISSLRLLFPSIFTY